MVNSLRLTLLLFILCIFSNANATIYPTSTVDVKTIISGSKSYTASPSMSVCTTSSHLYNYWGIGPNPGGACYLNNVVHMYFSACSETSATLSSQNSGLSGVTYTQVDSDFSKGPICPGSTYPGAWIANYPYVVNKTCPSNSDLVSSGGGYDGSTCSCKSGYADNGSGSCSLAPCPNGQVRKSDMSCYSPSCSTGSVYAPIDPYGKGIKKISCKNNCIESSWISPDGSSSVLSSVGGSCDYDFVPSCPTGMSPITIAGQLACSGGQPNTPTLIPTATPGNQSNTTVNATVNIDGSKTVNNTTTTTNCTADGKCTTTNITTINNYNSAGALTGTTNGPTTTTTTDGTQFCAQNPTSPQCVNNSNLDPTVPATSSTTVDVSSNIQNDPRLLTETCLTPPTFTVAGVSYTMNLSLFCNFLGMVGYMMVAASSVICIRMITSGGSN